jgi:hypothetical protein
MDLDWPRIWITVLTVAAFALSATGLLLLRRDAARSVSRMDGERVARDTFTDELRAVTQNDASTQDQREEAHALWVRQHEEIGIKPLTYGNLEQGREPLAERIIRELDQGSRVDVVLVGAGLLCGLAASIWGTWLPSA